MEGFFGRHGRSLFAVLLALFALTRLYDLEALPLFNDQAIYLRWSQILVDHPTMANAFLSTIDGKQPFSMWLVALVLPLIGDGVWAERFLSALVGVGTVALGARFLSRRFSRSAGLVFLALCLASPYLLLFQRYALVESLLLFFPFCLFVLLWEFYDRSAPRYTAVPLILAVMAMGFLNKSPFMLAALASLSFPLFFRRAEGLRARIVTHLFMLAMLAFVPLLIGQAVAFLHLPQRSGADQLFHNAELVKVGLVGMAHNFLWNVRQAVGLLLFYVSLPVTAVAVLSFASLARKEARIVGTCLAFVVVPVICVSLVVDADTPLPGRYFLIVAPFIFIPPAVWLGALLSDSARAVSGAVVLALALVSPVSASVQLLADPATAPLYPSDRFGYVTGWPSGYGVRAAARYIEEDAAGAPALVLTHHRWGNPSDGMKAYFWRSDVVTVEDAWWSYYQPVVPGAGFRFASYESKYTRPLNPKKVIDIDRFRVVYFVCRSGGYEPNRETFLTHNPDLVFVKAFPKPDGLESVDLYRWDGRTLLKPTGKVLWFNNVIVGD